MVAAISPVDGVIEALEGVEPRTIRGCGAMASGAQLREQ